MNDEFWVLIALPIIHRGLKRSHEMTLSEFPHHLVSYDAFNRLGKTRTSCVRQGGETKVEAAGMITLDGVL